MPNEFRVSVLQVPNDAGVMTTVASDADELNNLTTRKEVTNPTGGGYAAGDLVYISGHDGTYPEVTLADGDDTLSRATYVCVEVIAAGAQGFVDADITLSAMNTLGQVVGDAVYLTATGTTTNTWAFAALTGASQVDQQVGTVSVVGAAGSIHFFISDTGIRGIGTDALMDGVLSADAAGRALVATGFYDAATALDKVAAGALDATFCADRFSAGAMDNTAVANAFAADSFTNAEVGVFQDNFFAADATSRAKISTNFFDAATALDLFAAGAFDNTAVNNAFAASAFTNVEVGSVFDTGSFDNAAVANAFAADSFTNTEIGVFQDDFFAADDVSRAKFAADFLGNTAVGRALVATGFFDVATLADKVANDALDAAFVSNKFNAASFTTANVANAFDVGAFDSANVTNVFDPASIADNVLASSIQKDLSASKATGSILFDAAFVALANYDTMTWDLDGRTYEIAQTGNFAGGANVEIVTDGDASVQDIVDTLVAGIMGDGGRTVDAYDAGNETVCVSWTATGTAGNAIVFAEDLDPNNKALVSGAGTLEGGQDTWVKAQARLTKTITADEVTALAAGCEVLVGLVDLGGGGAPTALFPTLRPAGGAYSAITGLDFNFTLVAGTEYMVSVTDAVALLANTDVLEVVIEAI